MINNDKVASAVLLEAFLTEGESAVLTKALWQLFNLNIQILNGYILESLNPYKRTDKTMTQTSKIQPLWLLFYQFFLPNIFL